MTNNNEQCPENHYPYIIQSGDTINDIADRLEVSTSRIIAANPEINPNNLRVGEVLCIPACLPNQKAVIIQPGDTLYDFSQTYNVSISSILEANPGIDPRYLRVGQRICIPMSSTPEYPDYQETIRAMQSDINMLKAESSVQQTEEKNYGNSTKKTRVIKFKNTEIQFDAVPSVTFSGNYKGHFSYGKSYPYYSSAAMGGRRMITVKDNFGVWHTFRYRVQLPNQ